MPRNPLSNEKLCGSKDLHGADEYNTAVASVTLHNSRGEEELRGTKAALSRAEAHARWALPSLSLAFLDLVVSTLSAKIQYHTVCCWLMLKNEALRMNYRKVRITRFNSSVKEAHGFRVTFFLQCELLVRVRLPEENVASC